jgi:hypothetical protein
LIAEGIMTEFDSIPNGDGITRADQIPTQGVTGLSEKTTVVKWNPTDI